LPVTSFDISGALSKAVADKDKGLGNLNLKISKEVLDFIANLAAGDLRIAYNALEMCALSVSPESGGEIIITKEIAAECLQNKPLSIDENSFYDMLSAFCKSLRGSDSDAAVYWALRLIDGGCDPLTIARRLIVHSAEDVGIANPNALLISVAALTALEKIGLPEGKIPLTEAIIYVCESEKSNSVVNAIGRAENDIKNRNNDIVPPYLTKMGGSAYKYPHSFGGYVKQDYLPKELKDSEYYIPGNNGEEKGLIKKKKRNK
jgi:putative ATPase